MEPGDERRKWTLLTGHGHVLVEIARNPHARLRDISPVVGLTERTKVMFGPPGRAYVALKAAEVPSTRPCASRASTVNAVARDWTRIAVSKPERAAVAMVV